MIIKNHNKDAIIYAGNSISYQQLIDNSFLYSKLLDVKSGGLVAICAENRPEWYFSFYSIWIKHAAALAVDFMSSAEEISFILSDSAPECIFTTNSCIDKVREACELSKYSPKIINIDNIALGDKEPENHQSLEFEDDNSLAIMIYTSGTTGKPKGVMLSKKNIAANLKGIDDLKIFSKNDIYAVILPFHHIYPLTGTVILPLFEGSTVVIIEKLASDVIMGAFQKYKITILFGIPRLYAMFHKSIMDKINSKFITKTIFNIAKFIPFMKVRKIIFGSVHKAFGGHLRYFLSGGSKLNDKIMEDFGILGIKVTEGYGLSETSPMNSANNSPGIYKKGTIGKPMSNVKMKIIDGEICVQGDHIMMGYYNRPEETAEALKDGWFHTGDAGWIDRKGFITITGRKKELIVLPNGKKVNPEEIESKILELYPDMIKEIGVFSKDNGLFAVVLPDFEFLKKNNLVNIFETIRWQVIDKYNRASRDFRKILNFRIVTDELPRTRVGKLKRFMFPSLLENVKKTEKHPEDPDEAQYIVFKNYMISLTNKEVYPDSHLEFDLGIDSLAKIEMESFIENTFGVTISGSDLLGRSTVIELYSLIKEKMTRMEGAVDSGWHKILNSDTKIKIKGNGLFTIIFKIGASLFIKVYLGLKVTGRKNIPNKSVIFAPNHQSFLDGLLMIIALPGRVQRKTYIIANEKHFEHWWMRLIARYSNIIMVNINMNLKDSLQRIAQVLKKNKNVIIFPEGARTRDGNLMEFKKFFAILSRELNIPVVPVAINGALKSLPVDKHFPKPGKISIDFMNPVEPEEMDYDEITQKVRDIIKTVVIK